MTKIINIILLLHLIKTHTNCGGQVTLIKCSCRTKFTAPMATSVLFYFVTRKSIVFFSCLPSIKKFQFNNNYFCSYRILSCVVIIQFDDSVCQYQWVNSIILWLNFAETSKFESIKNYKLLLNNFSAEKLLTKKKLLISFTVL